MLYRGGVIKWRAVFVPAAGAKILAMLTVNHYNYYLKLFEIDATHTLLTTTNEYAVPTTTMTH